MRENDLLKDARVGGTQLNRVFSGGKAYDLPVTHEKTETPDVFDFLLSGSEDSILETVRHREFHARGVALREARIRRQVEKEPDAECLGREGFDTTKARRIPDAFWIVRADRPISEIMRETGLNFAACKQRLYGLGLRLRDSHRIYAGQEA